MIAAYFFGGHPVYATRFSDDGLVSLAAQDTLREDCDSSTDCVHNCCVSRVVAPVFFVVFVLVAQFVLVNVVVAVLMKHLEVRAALSISKL